MITAVIKLIELCKKDKPLTTILLFEVFLIGVVFFLLKKSGLIYMFFEKNTLILARFTISFLLLFIGAVIYILILRKEMSKKINIDDDYEYKKYPGFYLHKEKKEFACTPCLLKEKIHSPLYKIPVNQWECRTCGKTFQEYKSDYNDSRSGNGYLKTDADKLLDGK